MNDIYTEKEVLTDALNTEKNSTNLYNMSVNECVHDNLRSTIMDLLKKEHEIQVDVFNQMHTMGYYPTPAADGKKIQEARTKFECGYKAV
jgi:spore coat protein CotF